MSPEPESSAPPDEAGRQAPVPAPEPEEAKPVKRRSPGPERHAVGIAPGSWSVLTVLLGVLVAIVGIVIGIAIVAALDPDLESQAATIAAQVAVAAALIGAALIFALADPMPGVRALTKLGLRHVGWVGLALGLAGWIAYVLAASQIAPFLQPEQEDVTRDLGVDESTLGLIVAAFVIVVLAPLSEEIFFRGFAFAGLRRRLSLWPAAAISSIGWAMLHLGPGNPGVVVQLALFGLVLAWLYEQTGSLWPPILAHGLNNAIAFTVLQAT